MIPTFFNRCISFSLLLIVLTTNISAKALDDQTIDGICKIGQENIMFILTRLFTKNLSIVSDKNLETYRSVYSEVMKEDLLRAQKFFKKEKDANTKIDAYLGLNEIHYKFGLCEKYKRNEAIAATIADEYYFLCRKQIFENRNLLPVSCF